MPEIDITVESPDRLLNAGQYGVGALIQVQSATSEAGTYADLSGTGSTSTIALALGSFSYVAYDPLGTFSTWYRTRFKSADGARVSVDWVGDPDWATKQGHAPFQVGADSGGGHICAIVDVRQLLGLAVADTSLDEQIIEERGIVQDEIETYCHRRFRPDPLYGTTTHYFDGSGTSRLHIARGIRSLTSLGIASDDQPSDGTGTGYTAVTVSRVYLDPPTSERDDGWPALWLTLGSTAEVGYFPPVRHGVKAVGAFGPAASPRAIQGVAVRYTHRRVLARQSGQTGAIGPDAEGGFRMPPILLEGDYRILDLFRDGSMLIG